MSVTPLAATADPDASRISVKSLLAQYGAYAGAVLFLLVVESLSPAFLSRSNVANMLQQMAPLGIVVLGQTFVILVGGLDLSVASIMATAAVVAATALGGSDGGVWAIVGTSLAIGLGVGLMNGVLVTKRSVSPFLATLSTSIVLEGLRYAYTEGAPSGNVPPALRIIGSGAVYGFPYNLLLMALLALALIVVQQRSLFGRWVYLVGGNRVMARLVGLNADRITIVCYVLSGCLAAVGGLVLSGFTGVVDNFVGRGFEIDSIVAAVLGGVSLAGGRGTVLGALIGTALLVLISNAVLMVGLPVQTQLVIKGSLILVAAVMARGPATSL